MKTKILTRNVWILSLVSLFADVASEMLYPVMPIYLKSIGFSILLIGILEGVAEATAGFSKGYFGKLSDASGTRLPFIRWGYLLSTISKPMMAIWAFPFWVFVARTIDRLGKGLRTGARDALLSDEASPATKARVFGFHRGMDTLGAVIGPCIALLYLHSSPAKYSSLFYFAFVPGLISVLLIYLLKEKKTAASDPGKNRGAGIFSFLQYWKTSPAVYRKLVTGLLIFTLFNSSDFFLLLKMKDAGLNDTYVVGIYIFYNLVYAAFAYPFGALADRFGLKNVFLTGLIFFAIVYLGMASTNNLYIFFLLFFFYGMYAAATEGISKAWITNISSREETATAIGLYTALQSLSVMLASFVAGLVWFEYGAAAIFTLSGMVAVLVSIYLLIAIKAGQATPSQATHSGQTV